MHSVESHGFILIAVLWISLLLSVFALNMASRSRLQGVLALNMQQRYLQEQDLLSALDKGRHEYLKYLQNKQFLAKKQEYESRYGKELELWYPRFEPYSLQLGEQEYAVQVLDLRGRLDINKAAPWLMLEVIRRCPVPEELRAEEVADPILDWMDQDESRREHGAEADYYLGLPQPYLPKNGPLQSIQELLLVKGVSRELLEGNKERPGLRDFFAAQGGALERMEINSASPRSFALLQDLPQESIQAIVQHRKQKPIDSLSQLGEILPAGFLDQLRRYYQAEPGAEQGAIIRACSSQDRDDQGNCRSRLQE